MISVTRGSEPAALATARTRALGKLRGLGRPPTSEEIDGYRVVAADLWRSQHHKCCYCDCRIPLSYYDLEHYRP